MIDSRLGGAAKAALSGDVALDRGSDANSIGDAGCGDRLGEHADHDA